MRIFETVVILRRACKTVSQPKHIHNSLKLPSKPKIANKLRLSQKKKKFIFFPLFKKSETRNRALHLSLFRNVLQFESNANFLDKWVMPTANTAYPQVGCLVHFEKSLLSITFRAGGQKRCKPAPPAGMQETLSSTFWPRYDIVFSALV